MSTTAKPRRITDAKKLRAAIEVEEKVSFWGQEYRIKPRFVEAKFGNGRKLLAVQPLNTRPNYYVIRIDSRWYRERRDSTIIDHMDDIVDAICDEYSDIERERGYLIEDGVSEEDADLANYEAELGWPVFSGDSGYAWFEVDWPTARRKGA